jgi:hypothetical protein
MTKTQEEIARKISGLLGEHFNSSLLVLASDQMDEDDFISVRFFGGCLTAVGMAEFAKNSLNSMLDDASEPHDDQEDAII